MSKLAEGVISFILLKPFLFKDSTINSGRESALFLPGKEGDLKHAITVICIQLYNIRRMYVTRIVPKSQVDVAGNFKLV